jgi:hypothetical protein
MADVITTNNDVIDIDLSITNKKKVRINGDDSKILELNISDAFILERLETALKEMQAIINNIQQASEDEDATSEKYIRILREADTALREKIDYIFDAPVSAVCGSGGSMYDPFEGEYRYEHIINTLINLYEKNITQEYQKLKAKVNKRTSKYTQHK